MAVETGTREIRTDYLARVEGEGGMVVTLRGDEVEDVQLKIYEPPRFFEALLQGRAFTEAPDITARICGICPVAYQMSSCLAMEQVCGARVDGQLRALRRLLYAGEWIESHTLHIYMLHAPDFLGVASAIELAQTHKDVVERALRMKKLGNEIMRVVGGREVHPINVKVGGWYRVPTKSELQALVPELEWALQTAVDTTAWASTLHFPDYEFDYELVALEEGEEYPIDRGARLRSNRGLDIPVEDFLEHVEELHVPHSNALHARLKERGAYLVGPLARFALHRELLSPEAQQAAGSLETVVRNPFKSIVVRSVELVEACSEALRLIREYERPVEPAVPLAPRAGIGHGATEAPRGVLYHRYELAPGGDILDATIIPPTSQNQMSIEDDLRRFVTENVTLEPEELSLRCEQAIRNYDPCISCATHFLDLRIERV